MKRKMFGFGVLILFLLSISLASADDVMNVVVRPLVNGTIQPSTSFDYIFNFTTDAGCSDVLLSRSATITTDPYGMGDTNINVLPLLTTNAPLFMCEYRDGTLRTVHDIGYSINKASRQKYINSDNYCDNTTCYTLDEIYNHIQNMSQLYNDINLHNGTDGIDGINGVNLTITSITSLGDGTFQWNFSDGYTFITDNLTGQQGIQGLQGIQGVAGLNGTNGNDGLNGLNGTSVTLSSIENNLDGTYTWHFSDGFNFTTGNLTGLKGDTGSQGIQGLQGVAGLNGTNGIDGQNGSQGIQGIQGLQGVAGLNGTNGNDGLNGLNGTSVTLSSIENNLDGTYTWHFSDGFNFTTGNLTGLKGDTGSQGIQGLQGVAGLNGSNGLDGSDANLNNVSKIHFNTTYSGSTDYGDLSWDGDYQTLIITGTNTNLQLGQENYIRVINGETFEIEDGQFVYISGSNGIYPEVSLTLANDFSMSRVVGMATEHIASGEQGFVTWFGVVHDLNTSDYQAGDTIYLSPTDLGGYTPTRPIYPNYAMSVGKVVASDETLGSIIVLIRVSEIDPYWNAEKGNYYTSAEIIQRYYNKTESDLRYLQNESDPIYSSDKTNIIFNNNTQWIRDNQIFRSDEDIVNTTNQTGYTYNFNVLWANVIGRFTNLSQFYDDVGFLLSTDQRWNYTSVINQEIQDRNNSDNTLNQSIQNLIITNNTNLSINSLTSNEVNSKDINLNNISIDLFKYSISTGIIEGGSLSINPDGTSIDITAGTSLYVDFSDINNPIIEKLYLNSTTIDAGLTSDVSRKWIGINRTSQGVGSIVLKNDFTDLEKRKIAVLGRVWGTGNATLEGVGQYSTPAFYVNPTLIDLINTLGSLNKEGNIFSGSVYHNLQLDKSSGKSFRFSANFLAQPTSPNIQNDPVMINISAYHYHKFNDTSTELQSSIDPNNYDVNGVKTSVPAGNFTIQRIYFFPKSNVVDIVYGQAIYSSLSEAKLNIQLEQVQIDDTNLANLQGSILRGYLVVQQGATDLTDTSKAVIISATNLGSGGGVGITTGISTHNLLENLLGGNSTERYHLYLNDYDNVINRIWDAINTTNNIKELGFTTTADLVSNYYNKTEVYNKTEIDNKNYVTNDSVNKSVNPSDIIFNDGISMDTFKYSLSTGILEGGDLSINPNNTSIDISAGTSLYVNLNDINNPIVEILHWNATTLDAGLTSIESRKWIGIQRASEGVGTFILTDSSFEIPNQFSPLQKRTIAILGRVWGSGTANIDGVGQYSTPAFYSTPTLYDLINTLGSLNRGGNIFTANAGNNLHLDKSSGRSFRASANFLNEPTSPNIQEDLSMVDIDSYNYHNPNSSTTTILTDIDPEYYDLNGVKTSIPSGNFSIQRIYYFPKSQVIDILYGHDYYSTLSDAKLNIQLETVDITNDVLANLEGSILRGYIVIQQGTTNLTDTSKVSIISATNLGTGGGIGAVTSIKDHNLLENIQGGQVEEYYHLSNSSYLDVLNKVWNLINSTSNIQSLGFNTTLQLDGRYLQSYLESDPKFTSENGTLWSAINDKVNGSASINHIPKMSATKTLTNSSISDDGTFVTVTNEYLRVNSTGDMAYLDLTGLGDGTNYAVLQLANQQAIPHKWQFSMKSANDNFVFDYYNGTIWKFPFTINASSGELLMKEETSLILGTSTLTGGTNKYVPMFDSKNTVTNSIINQSTDGKTINVAGNVTLANGYCTSGASGGYTCYNSTHTWIG